MQSAALGFMLAQAHFADPMVAVPSAVSVVFMVRPADRRSWRRNFLKFYRSSEGSICVRCFRIARHDQLTNS
jgi:hypothetical protein